MMMTTNATLPATTTTTTTTKLLRQVEDVRGRLDQKRLARMRTRDELRTQERLRIEKQRLRAKHDPVKRLHEMPHLAASISVKLKEGVFHTNEMISELIMDQAAAVIKKHMRDHVVRRTAREQLAFTRATQRVAK
eukprot:1391301-Prymnesium_polylepis.1